MHKKIRRLPSGKQRKEYIQFVEKVCFFKKCLFSIPIPFRTLCWLCFCATVVVCCRCVLHRLCSTTCMRHCIKPLGVLSRHPCRNHKPLSPVKGCVCLVGFASCKALVHTRPASVPGLYYWGYRPRPSKDACSQPHKATARCSGTNG